MKGLSLFSGIGGLDLSAIACGITPVAMCEIEPFPVQILKKRFPGVPVLPDVKKVNGHDYRGTVDIIFGGFPCQDLSVAGRRAGLLDADGNTTRSGLWFEMLRIISEARPRFVVAENVRGAINAALDVVQSGLESEGYEVRTILLPASAVGAPHQRERIFVLGIRKDVLEIEGEYRSRSIVMANSGTERLQGGECSGVNFEKERQSFYGAATECRNDSESCVWRTPDANMTRGAISEEKYIEREQQGMPNALNYQVAHEERRWSTPQASDSSQGAVIGKGDTFKRLPSGRLRKINKNGVDGSVGLAREVVLDNGQAAPIVTADNAVKGQLNPAWVEQLMGYPDGWTDPDCDEPMPWAGWPARPGEQQYPYEHPRTVVGMPNRAKRLKALGNAVVPQQAEPIFRAVEMIDKLTREK